MNGIMKLPNGDVLIADPKLRTPRSNVGLEEAQVSTPQDVISAEVAKAAATQRMHFCPWCGKAEKTEAEFKKHITDLHADAIADSATSARDAMDAAHARAVTPKQAAPQQPVRK